MIIGTAAALACIPAYSPAATYAAVHPPKVSASESPSPSAGTATTGSSRTALIAARTEYRNAMVQFQNGRDLAFADANATMLAALTAAGKDKVAMKAAHTAYRAAAMQIISAYKQAVATAMQNYKNAIAAAKGK